MHANYEHRDPGESFANVLRDQRTRHARQCEIHQHHIGAHTLCSLHRLLTIAGFTDNTDVGLIFERATECTSHKTVVVDDQNGGDAIGRALLTLCGRGKRDGANPRLLQLLCLSAPAAS
jgi:hypothetical protein